MLRLPVSPDLAGRRCLLWRTTCLLDSPLCLIFKVVEAGICERDLFISAQPMNIHIKKPYGPTVPHSVCEPVFK